MPKACLNQQIGETSISKMMHGLNPTLFFGVIELNARLTPQLRQNWWNKFMKGDVRMANQQK